MVQGSKITFSDAEMEAITHPDFFYVKHAAMNKVMEMLSETERGLREIILLHPWFAKYSDIESPRIFRGENYRKLPYMVLDFPRKFSADTICSFRSMFWWGMEFSFTLHLQGHAYQMLRKKIGENLSSLAGSGFYLCVNKTPWQYHFENDNYLSLDELLKGDPQLNEKLPAEFIKLSRKITIGDINRVPAFSAETLSMLLQVLR